MAPSNEVPFDTEPNKLYTGEDLWNGFNVDDPSSFQKTLDFKCYQYFVKNGRATVRDKEAAKSEALHDSSILFALHTHLQNKNRVVAIMGGHRMERGTRNYRLTVELAQMLSQQEFLVVSGGGPGAMEATHLGALLKGANQAEFDDALKTLTTQPSLPPNAYDVVDNNGNVNTKIAEKLYLWAVPAHEVRNKYLTDKSGESLAIPSWHYGHEPVTPLATKIAKIFQNSIREDVLLLVPRQGIVYTPGGAGTLQEVFQDAAQNYYVDKAEDLYPMVFFDMDNKTWSQKYPVQIILDKLFDGRGNEVIKGAYLEKCTRLDTVDEIVRFLVQLANQSPKLAAGSSALSFRGF